MRYCAEGMDAAQAADTILEDEPEHDRYVLEIWPEAPSPDQAVKSTSAASRCWHDWVRRLKQAM